MFSWWRGEYINKTNLQNLPDPQPKMQNRTQHRIDQLNCCHHPHPCYPEIITTMLSWFSDAMIFFLENSSIRETNKTFKAFMNLAVPLCAIVPRQSTNSCRVIPIPESLTKWKRIDSILINYLPLLKTKKVYTFKAETNKTYVRVMIPFSLSE